MAAYDRVLVEITDHVGTATLNRPEKANAFDPDMCEDLLEALRMLASADAVRVIVVTGAGKAFCAGADLGVLGTEGEKLVKAGKDIALTIRNAPKPVLAAEATVLAGRWAGMAPLAVRKAKAALYRSLHSTLEEMLDVEIADQEALFATPEARQLIRNR